MRVTMTKKLIILAVIFSLCVLAFAAGQKPICSACKKEIKTGEYLAGVQGANGVGHVHFTCALKKHLNRLPEK